MSQQPTLAASPKGTSLSTDGAYSTSIDVVLEVHRVRDCENAQELRSLTSNIFRTERNDSKIHNDFFREPLMLVHPSYLFMDQNHAVLTCWLTECTFWYRRLYFHKVRALGNDVGVDPNDRDHTSP